MSDVQLDYDEELRGGDDLREGIALVTWIIAAACFVCGFAFGLLCGKVPL